MTSFWLLFGVCGALAVAVWCATFVVRRGLIHWSVYDRPNRRSSHTVPRPRGGGLALVPLLLLAWALAAWRLGGAPAGFWPVLAGALMLALVSLLDDMKGLSIGPRILIQIAAVGIGLVALADAGPVFQGLLPPLFDRLAAALLWLWFVNLFNFMDGIDGLAGVEAIAVATGLALVAWTAGLPGPLLVLSCLLAAAVAGFLAWNWEPARIFLGDVGSVPLGYLLGWLLLHLAAEGQWAAAAILPLYYLSDATLTVVKRGLRGERVWRAHREHAYQRAVRGGFRHAEVAARVALCNVALVTMALAAARGYPWAALGVSLAAVALLLGVLERRARKPR